MSKTQSSDSSVGEIVATADRQRRWRDGVRLSTRVAPATAVVVAAVALLVRFAGWPRAIVPALLGLGLVVVGITAWVVRRPRPATVSMAGRLDRDAKLGGELASAYWFSAERAARPGEPGAQHDWVAFHVEQAVARARDVAWHRLYAPPPARGTWAVSLVLAIVALGASTLLPARVATRPTPRQALAATLAHALDEAVVTPATRADLEHLVATLERGELTAADLEQASALIDLATVSDTALRERLQDLLSQAASDARIDLAKANVSSPVAASSPESPGRRADEPSSPAEDWARDERAAEQAAAAAVQSGEPTSSPAATSEAGADRSTAGQPGSEARDSVSALGAGQMTIADEGTDANGASGYPMGGRSNGVKAASVAITLPAALAREVIEAHEDSAGADVKNDERRRQSEQAASGVGSTGSAARLTFDRAHVAAPMPVPEARRALIEGYFARP